MVERCPALVLALLLSVNASAGIDKLQVEYRDNPMGLDVPAPRFSWQTSAAPGTRGIAQSAYRISVTDPFGAMVWDSGKVTDGRSVDIGYAGAPLQPATRYNWRVTAWQNGAEHSAQSWFETGLMYAGWEGATWIGGADSDRVLYSQYLPLFDLSYTLTIAPGSERAAIVFAANDSRLMDPNKKAAFERLCAPQGEAPSGNQGPAPGPHSPDQEGVRRVH